LSRGLPCRPAQGSRPRNSGFAPTLPEPDSVQPNRESIPGHRVSDSFLRSSYGLVLMELVSTRRLLRLSDHP